MIQNIIDAISMKIDELYPEAKIRDEEIKQGLECPCFYIHLIDLDYKQYIGNRFFLSQPFQIVYFPKEDSNDEMNGVLFNLLPGLRRIKLLDGQLLNGTKLRGQVIDGVVQFSVNYDVFMRELPEQKEKMEGIEVNGETQGA